MSRNIDMGSRDMFIAGCNGIRKEIRSFSSINTLIKRWLLFTVWAKKRGIRRMEQVGKNDIIQYGLYLAEMVQASHLSTATAKNYLSAVNRVFEIARCDKDIWAAPTDDCGIPRRKYVAETSHATTINDHINAIKVLDPRLACLIEMQRAFGLRFEESAKIDAKASLASALKHGSINILTGTKGGRKRKIAITSENQISILTRAASIQGNDRSMIPGNLSYAEFQRQCYSRIRKTKVRFHGERHAYAQQRYKSLTGVDCPVVAGIPHGSKHHAYLSEILGIPIHEAIELDEQARTLIANELGHNREAITNVYIG